MKMTYRIALVVGKLKKRVTDSLGQLMDEWTTPDICIVRIRLKFGFCDESPKC